MAHELPPDDLARKLGPEPTEPIESTASTLGTVKWWRDEKGYGAISSEQTAPHDIWCHFSALDLPGYRTLTPGQRVQVDYERADQDSFKYRATTVRAIT